MTPAPEAVSPGVPWLLYVRGRPAPIDCYIQHITSRSSPVRIDGP